jgi:hypothetical protein
MNFMATALPMEEIAGSNLAADPHDPARQKQSYCITGLFGKIKSAVSTDHHTAIVESALGSVPPHKMPLTGSRTMICPRPKSVES